MGKNLKEIEFLPKGSRVKRIGGSNGAVTNGKEYITAEDYREPIGTESARLYIINNHNQRDFFDNDNFELVDDFDLISEKALLL